MESSAASQNPYAMFAFSRPQYSRKREEQTLLNDWPISMHSLRKNSHQHMHNEMGAHRMTSALKVARNDQKSKWTLTLMSIYPTLMPRWQQHCASVEHVLVSES